MYSSLTHPNIVGCVTDEVEVREVEGVAVGLAIAAEIDVFRGCARSAPDNILAWNILSVKITIPRFFEKH